jgi:hypothetical protein
MSAVSLGCIVEGEGEEAALPILIRRVAERIDPTLAVQMPRAVCVHRNRLKREDLEQAIRRTVNLIQRPCAIFLLADADTDCPAVLGPELLERISVVRKDIPMAVVLAQHEYECWFLAAAESLRGHRGLAADLQAPADPEAIQDGKGWLRARMPKTRKYAETADQPALTALFDIDLARSRSPLIDVTARSSDCCERSCRHLRPGRTLRLRPLRLDSLLPSLLDEPINPTKSV